MRPPGICRFLGPILPTILEVTGIRVPDTVDGIAQKPIEGVSLAYTFDKENANAPTTHHTQYFESSFQLRDNRKLLYRFETQDRHQGYSRVRLYAISHVQHPTVIAHVGTLVVYI
jgi:arylsulfatase A-like enzyme